MERLLYNGWKNRPGTIDKVYGDGRNGRIAVKIVDDGGIESLGIMDME